MLFHPMALFAVTFRDRFMPVHARSIHTPREVVVVRPVDNAHGSCRAFRGAGRDNAIERWRWCLGACVRHGFLDLERHVSWDIETRR